MRTLFFDLGMGAAGDMISAALFELLDEKGKEDFLLKINHAGIPGVSVSVEKSVKCGIVGTHIKVTVNGEEEESLDADHEHHGHEHHHEEHEHHHEHEHGHHEHENHEHGHHEHHEEHHHHHHTSMAEIESIVGNLNLSDSVKSSVIQIYKLIAEAESNAHGRPVSEIHFHEVGTMDAVADIASACLLFEMLAPQKIFASAVNVGSGHVHCAHGILPVPAPATAFILKDIPIYSGHISGELCTPTGAAILRHFVNQFGQMPPLRPFSYGYGMGKKDFEAANCVRVILGETDEAPEKIYEYTCNLDDISAEKIAFAMERLFEAGAVEAYTIPVTMKKSRPGHLLCVMCREKDKAKILDTIFRHTTTLGVRENVSNRYFMERKIETIKTEFGDVRVKKAGGFGVSRQKLEFEDLAKIARETGCSIAEIEKKINASL